MNHSRHKFAFLLAPWAAPLCLVTFVAAVSEIQLPDALFLGGVTLLVSYIGALVLVLPMVRLLKKYGFLNLQSLAGAGIVGGVLLLFGFGWLRDGFQLSMASLDWLSMVWGAGLGFIVCLTFGLIAGVSFRDTGSEGA